MLSTGFSMSLGWSKLTEITLRYRMKRVGDGSHGTYYLLVDQRLQWPEISMAKDFNVLRKRVA